VQSRDGRWFMLRIRPYRTVEDRIVGVVLTFVDISTRRETERELRESRQQYETLFNSIDEGFCIAEVIADGQDGAPADYRFLEVNKAFGRQTGLTDVIGKTARELIPGLEEHWFETYVRVAASGQAERLEAPAKALGRYYEVYAFPVDAGSKRHVVMLFRDISERKQEEKQRELLTHELSHRVKNSLAVIQALARRPVSEDLTVAEYRHGLIGRIQALAIAHDQLLETNWQSADLETLLEQTLSAYQKPGEHDLKIAGPPVRLTPKQGLGIALILHELATNAAKYGCLSTHKGRLSVTWDVEQGKTVHLVWEECDGPPPPADAGKGFGTKLIERACTYELGGKAELLFQPQGLVAEITFSKE